MTTDEDLTRALARHNPLPEHTVRSVTDGQHRDIAHAWTDEGVVPSLAPVGAGARFGGRPGRRATSLLVAAAVTGLVAASALVGGGGLQGLQDRVAVAGMPEVPTPDRTGEAARYDAWAQEVVDCLVVEYEPWVSAVDGGYVHDREGQVATLPSGGSASFSEDDCRAAAGAQPQPAPMTPEETRQHLVELRETGQCLRGLGYEVPEAPSLEAFHDSWQDELPDAPPWTPYAEVPDADVVGATEACGLPAPASRARWTSVRGAELDRSPEAPEPAGTHAAAVRFLTATEFAEVKASCLTDLGVTAQVVSGGLEYENADEDEQQTQVAVAVCGDRYPQNPLYELPLSQEQLSTLYDWYVQTSEPCLQQRGVTVEPAPTKVAFLDDYPDTWTPYDSVDIQDLSITLEDGTTLTGRGAWEDLEQACPQGPPDDVLFAN